MKNDIKPGDLVRWNRFEFLNISDIVSKGLGIVIKKDIKMSKIRNTSFYLIYWIKKPEVIYYSGFHKISILSINSLKKIDVK